ncbi:Putative dipeptidase SA1572 [Metamycoplasma arthritidis]|uniref:Acetylornithine deacetylase/succinyl-diaminopimelate desuccinylase n=1 Tax=Metamycoplasma arthritidis (strain 158L3-1) TaxID=243272 RepID=B3PLT7_META1|nr:Sapep family Mn(2+)-dependent dipeptidase [Metamycoplasma arthritidis]ACF06989.1 acetylornithine deacetylase/succinyl-diaminopimelate desuccinylase [Metamycoplasma arthritidis 158L3-1]VEU78518.1 Putative dipeptidase SA1572 [Metamycoplasma arthritidis]
MNKYKEYLQSEKEFAGMVNNIAKLCSIPSISIYKKDTIYPYGESVDKALNFTLNLAKSFGFRVYKDPANHYGFAQIGYSEKIIGILVHLDVVPAGDESKWVSSAFNPIIKDGELFGRGSLDDKGPAIINLYAMKYILDNNLLNENWSIRIIFGLSEETNMHSMKCYLHDFGAPYISYTPDGVWPLIYAEKMIYHVNLWFPKIDDLTLNGGEVINQIPELLNIKYSKLHKLYAYLNKGDFSYQNESETLILTGKSGHASEPSKGENVIIKFFKALVASDSDMRHYPIVKFIAENFSDGNFNLPKVFANCEDFSGKLTANIGMIKTTAENYVLSIDMRVPVTYDISQMSDGLNKYLSKLNHKIAIEYLAHKPSKLIAKDHKLVKLLMQTYNDVTDSKAEPIAIGGGTYARLIDTCVAFGSTRFMNMMHGTNERFTYSEMKEALEIYINALIKLQEYDNL